MQDLKLTRDEFKLVLKRAEVLRSHGGYHSFTRYLKHKFGPLTTAQVQTIWKMTTCASTAMIGRSQPDRAKMRWLMQRNLQPKTCALCGGSLTQGFHIDHAIPVKHGGLTTMSNLQPLCPSCNLKKGKKLLEVEQYAKIWKITWRWLL